MTPHSPLPALLRQPVPVAVTTRPAFIIPASVDEAEGIAALATLLATDDLALLALTIADGPYRDYWSKPSRRSALVAATAEPTRQTPPASARPGPSRVVHFHRVCLASHIPRLPGSGLAARRRLS